MATCWPSIISAVRAILLPEMVGRGLDRSLTSVVLSTSVGGGGRFSWEKVNDLFSKKMFDTIVQE